MHGIRRGAGYGHRSIGDDWIVDHLVEYLFRDAICVHIVDILGYFLALVTNALATGHREERTQRHARESLSIVALVLRQSYIHVSVLRVHGGFVSVFVHG